jgi:hypothetical protein
MQQVYMVYGGAGQADAAGVGFREGPRLMQQAVEFRERGLLGGAQTTDATGVKVLGNC